MTEDGFTHYNVHFSVEGETVTRMAKVVTYLGYTTTDDIPRMLSVKFGFDQNDISLWSVTRV